MARITDVGIPLLSFAVGCGGLTTSSPTTASTGDTGSTPSTGHTGTFAPTGDTGSTTPTFDPTWQAVAGVSWTGREWTDTGLDVQILLDEEGVAVAVSTPRVATPYIIEDFGSNIPYTDDPTDPGVRILRAPFLGGAAHDVATAAVLMDPNPYLGSQPDGGLGRTIRAHGDWMADGSSWLQVEGAMFRWPFLGERHRASAEADFIDTSSRTCDLDGDSSADLCRFGGANRGPLAVDDWIGDQPTRFTDTGRFDPWWFGDVFLVTDLDADGRSETASFTENGLFLVDTFPVTTLPLADAASSSFQVSGPPPSFFLDVFEIAFEDALATGPDVTGDGAPDLFVADRVVAGLLAPVHPDGPLADALSTTFRSDAGWGVPSTATFGDFDGEVAVGWPAGGHVSVFLGPLPPAELSESDAHLTFFGQNDLADHFGAALAAADLDADGRDDLLVGAPTAGRNLSGALHLLWGPGR